MCSAMFLLYVIAGCVLLCIGSAEDVVRSAEGHSRHSYPNPMTSHTDCGRERQSYICDPNNVISKSEADQLNGHLVDTVRQLHCPCSRYSCLQHNDGYKIGIALLRKIRPGEPFDESDAHDLSESEYNAKRHEWLLHEAELFAFELLENWKLGHCKEDVIVLYSVQDGVLYTAAGDTARMKLNNSVINEISHHAEPQFARGGSVFNGLVKMVKDYRSVFQGNYVRKPRAQRVRGNSALSAMRQDAGSFTAAVVALLLSVIIAMESRGTQ